MKCNIVRATRFDSTLITAFCAQNPCVAIDLFPPVSRRAFALIRTKLRRHIRALLIHYFDVDTYALTLRLLAYTVVSVSFVA